MVKIPWWEPQLAGSELARVTQVLDSNFLNDGDVTTAFEQRIADVLGLFEHAPVELQQRQLAVDV